jgi:hypothetical protein
VGIKGGGKGGEITKSYFEVGAERYCMASDLTFTRDSAVCTTLSRYSTRTLRRYSHRCTLLNTKKSQKPHKLQLRYDGYGVLTAYSSASASNRGWSWFR